VREMNDRNDEMDGALDRFARDAARPLREPVHVTEGFHARTMAAVRRDDTAMSSPALPARTFGIPALGMAAFAALLVGIAIGGAALGRTSTLKSGNFASNVPAPAPVVMRDTVHVVRFQLAAPGAHTVALVGDFNDWSKYAIVLKPADKPGVWTASVPLTRGRHEYAFIVDGKRWVADPYALTHRDEYDVESSVIRVGESGS
jgi:hypothetical protein